VVSNLREEGIMKEKEKYQGYVEREVTVTLPCSDMIQVALYLEYGELLLIPTAITDVLTAVVEVYFSKEGKNERA
jgi:hypothetical protein